MFSWLFSDPLKVGTPAPDFTLPDQGGQKVSLAKLRGRNVVLVFYPGDDTPGCTKQLCEFRDDWRAAHDLGVEIFGVNPQSARKATRSSGRSIICRFLCWWTTGRRWPRYIMPTG